MTNLRTISTFIASLGLGLAIVATPLTLSASFGFKPNSAVAKEAESRGGKNEAGDDKGGGGKDAEKGDDRGGNRGGDDHPGSHSQNGRNR